MRDYRALRRFNWSTSVVRNALSFGSPDAAWGFARPYFVRRIPADIRKRTFGQKLHLPLATRR
jgi:hypothetical protein